MKKLFTKAVLAILVSMGLCSCRMISTNVVESHIDNPVNSELVEDTMTEEKLTEDVLTEDVLNENNIQEKNDISENTLEPLYVNEEIRNDVTCNFQEGMTATEAYALLTENGKKLNINNIKQSFSITVTGYFLYKIETNLVHGAWNFSEYNEVCSPCTTLKYSFDLNSLTSHIESTLQGYNYGTGVLSTYMTDIDDFELSEYIENIFDLSIEGTFEYDFEY